MGVTRILTGHFFRRFFDNDTLQVEGDTVTTVARAVSAVAVPGLMFAFFLQNQYPARTRWGAIQDQFFFVLLSFVVMGLVTILEWEMLFPDRMDFLILGPLPLRSREMLGAKAAALAGFAGLFLFGTNALSTSLYPLVAKAGFWWPAVAQATAVGMAGMFAVMSFLALNGMLRSVLDTPRFRVVSPAVQMVSVMGLVLLLLGYLRYGDSLEALLSGGMGRMDFVRWVPPVWFLGLYDRMLWGAGAPAFAGEVAPYAVRGTAVAAGVVAVTYPVAWARMRRAAIEGDAGRRRRPVGWVSGVVHGVVRRPGERAVFGFIGQTMRRNTRYQVYLAMYCGTGLALAVACGVGERSGGGMGVSERGLRAVMPLLLFWVVAGLRTAFAMPLQMGARWVFRVAGGDGEGCVAAPRRWATVGAIGVVAVVLVGLWGAGLGWRGLVVQGVLGVGLCLLLTDGFFFRPRVPFTQPRMPGKVNFPLMLTLYVGVLGPFCFAMVWLAGWMERELWRLVWVGLGTAVVHRGLRWMARGPMEVEEEMEGYEGEFQLLNLS